MYTSTQEGTRDGTSVRDVMAPRVLVVDDERTVTEVVERYLRREGSSGPHHQDSGEAKIRESTAGVSRKPSSDGKAGGSSSKHVCGLTAWNT